MDKDQCNLNFDNLRFLNHSELLLQLEFTAESGTLTQVMMH